MSLGLLEKSVGISQMTGQRHSCKKEKKKSQARNQNTDMRNCIVCIKRESAQRFWRIHLRRGLVGIEARELGRSQCLSCFLWKPYLRGSCRCILGGKLSF